MTPVISCYGIVTLQVLFQIKLNRDIIMIGSYKKSQKKEVIIFLYNEFVLKWFMN